MQIIKYIKLPFRFNAALLQSETANLEKLIWQPHYQTLHYTGQWTALPLRSIDGSVEDIIVSPVNTNYEDTVFLQQCPYMRQVLQYFKCPLLAVRLLNLHAGAIIKEHTDAELNYEKGEVRIHIPITTHKDVEFVIQNEKLNLQQGECWYMNVNLPHSVKNNSPVNRIHLVIDAIVNDWVKELFKNVSKKNMGIIRNHLNIYTEKEQKEMIERLRQMNTPTSNKMADEIEFDLNNLIP
jgi:hypothetical protein